MTRVHLFAAQCALGAGAFLVPSLAHAEWLSGPSREISIADSASPDAPVSSYAYGPRAQASLGGDVALYTLRGSSSTLRLGGDALVAFEDAARHTVVPGETLRTSFEISGAWALTDFATRAFGPGRELELSLALGRHSALPMTDFTLGDSFHSDDVPFGAGGNYVGLDGAFRTCSARTKRATPSRTPGMKAPSTKHGSKWGCACTLRLGPSHSLVCIWI
jgi:hypothetical protein